MNDSPTLAQSLQRKDLPDTQKILNGKLSQPSQMYHLAPAMIVGCQLLHEVDKEALQNLTEEILRDALMAQFCYGNEEPQGWWQAVMTQRPEIFASVYQTFILGHLKAKQSHAFGLHHLAYKMEWKSIARLVTHDLLASVPVKISSQQLHDLACLLRAGLVRLPKEEFLNLCVSKLSKRSLDGPQRIYWLTAGFLLDETTYFPKLESALSGREIMIGYFSNFINSRQYAAPVNLSPNSLVRLIKVCAAYSQPDWGSAGSGLVRVHTPAMERGDTLRQWLIDLSQDTSTESQAALSWLSQELSATPWEGEVNYRRNHQVKKWREETYSSLTAKQLDAILNSGNSQNRSDFIAITHQTLKDLIKEIEDGPDDYWKQFWNVDQYGRPTLPKPEPECRNALAALWRKELQNYGIRLESEHQVKNTKSADMWLSQGAMSLPIEAKRQNHRDLWTAMRKQLMALYVIDPSTEGYGIYLIFWFGSDGIKAHEFKPKTPQELKHALDKQLHEHERDLIRVVVLNLDQKDSSKPS
jgi:hypothetical protein